jgi:hypothetical protein
MTKVSTADDGDLICRVEGLEIRAMERNGRYPAKEWALGLDKAMFGKLLGVAQLVANSIREGRPSAPGGRWCKVKNAKTKNLMELRVTAPGGRAPHLRMLFIRQGNILWAAHGFTKQKNQLQVADIAAADAIATPWLARRRR